MHQTQVIGVVAQRYRCEAVQMNDWDEIRYFLAVARAGTVRGAAERLGVNHSTVLRRIGQLEGKLNVLLFDRLPTGYKLSAAGEEVFELAEQMEDIAGRFEVRVVGRDQAERGLLRVAMPPSIATHLLTPDLVEFARLHPGIEIEVLGSNQPVNLTNRDADVAIRVVYDQNGLPLNLHGIKGPPLNGGIYIARDALAAHQQGLGEPLRWIVKSDLGIPDWAQVTSLPIIAVPYRTSDTDSQLAALHQGLGIAALSCFVGDADPLLVRVPDSPIRHHGDLWVLAQGETRKTRRVRLFTEFISRRLMEHAPVLAGERTSCK